MGLKKIPRYIIALGLLSGIYAAADASVYDGWFSYTSTAQVRYLTYFDDSLQVVTSGGWLKIDPLSREFEKLTNTGGLGTNDLYYLMKDAEDTVWLAGYGRLIKFKNGASAPYLFFDRNNELLTLYSLADDGDMIWVGTSTGLALFSKKIDGGQIEDYYYRFGDLDPEPAVYDLYRSGDTLWLATSAGLAVADKSNPDLLKSSVNWTTFSSSNFPELIIDTVTAVAHFGDRIFVGTPRGVFYMNIAGIDTSFVMVPTEPTFSVRHLIVQGDSLLIYGRRGFYIYTDGGITGHTSTVDDYAAGFFINGEHWLGTESRGVWLYDDGAEMKLDDGGLPGNFVTDLSSDETGSMAGAFRNNGAAVLDSGVWEALNLNVRDGATAVEQDRFGRVWVGTWGNGLFMDGNDTIFNYDETNSTLRGVLEGPRYVVVNRLAISPRHLLATCYRALDGRPVSIMDLENRGDWISFGQSDGIMSDRPLAIDQQGNSFAMGTENVGVYLYYYGPNPFDKSDDSVVNFREDNSWLGSNHVNAVTFGIEGVFWAGTKFGLSRYDPGIERFVNVGLPQGFGPEVTALAFDRRGNLWIGAHNGLARLDAAGRDIQVFNILNSGLVNGEVTSLVVNPADNNLWIGTQAGISVMRSLIGRPTSDMEQVRAFPNPFIIRGGDEVLRFNYSGRAALKIYGVDGALIRETDVNDGWDGTNQQGRKAASGPYLFLLIAPDGAVGRGKILLVRE